MSNVFRVPVLTPWRIRAAFVTAIAVDSFQLLLGPLGWAFIDEALDLIAMVLTVSLLGFHPLLLPSMFLELLPVVDMLPTWTGCVALVGALRRKETRPPVISTVPAASRVIDV